MFIGSFEEQLGQIVLKKRSNGNSPRSMEHFQHIDVTRKNGIENSSNMMNVPTSVPMNLSGQLQTELKNALK